MASKNPWWLPKKEVTPIEETPTPAAEKANMSKFIPKPKTIEAAKWDGTPEGAAEIKAVLEMAGHTMDRFSVSYDSNGKLDKYKSEIWFYRTREEGRPRDDDRYAWNTYTLADGWLVVEDDKKSVKKVSDVRFKAEYIELGQTTYEDFIDWVGSAT